MMTNSQSKSADTAWFQEARFGLFIHWGIYAIPGGEWNGETMDYIGEWIQSKFRIPNHDYEQLALQFNPTSFNAEEWVLLAKSAGMRYVVFTAKHHDGFALYGSKVDSYNIVDATPFRRDPLAELAETCAKHGLRLGLYYSQDLDWHHPEGGDPGPAQVKNYGMSWGNDWDFPDTAAKNFGRYFNEKSLPQVKELLTNYGPISLMWFDCPMNLDAEDSHKLMKVVHDLQPDCLVNSRVGNGYGDFLSMGDNQVPVNKVKGIWECAATLNDTWGFKYSDHNWKSGLDTLAILIGLASRGVNYLLNIGPQPDGAFPQPSIDALTFLGRWMEANSEAIHGTQESPFASEFSWGWITAKAAGSTPGSRLYLIFKTLPEGNFVLRGVRNRVLSASTQQSPSHSFSQSQEQGCCVLNIDFAGASSVEPFPVLLLHLEGELDIDPRLLAQHGDEINLPSGQGSFVKVESDTSPALNLQAADFVGPAGEITRVESEPSLSDSGFIINWLSPNYEMQWEFIAPAPGEYEVEIMTCSPHHGLPWEGGHRVRLEIEDQAINATLEADELLQTPDAIYYAKAISSLGSIRINASGSQRATLKALSIQENQGVGLSLVHIKLRRIPD